MRAVLVRGRRVAALGRGRIPSGRVPARSWRWLGGTRLPARRLSPVGTGVASRIARVLWVALGRRRGVTLPVIGRPLRVSGRASRGPGVGSCLGRGTPGGRGP